MSACGTTRKTQKTVVAKNADEQQQVIPVDSAETIESVLAHLNKIDYNTFSGKIDASYNDSKGKDYNFDVKLNMKKDELIWLSITGPLSIEIARGLITKDSVKILNKLEKVYIASSIDYLQDKLGLPLDLHTLQDLLIGNPVFINKEKSSYEKETDVLQIISETQYFKNLLAVAIPGYLPVLSKLEDVDNTKKRSAILAYKDYKQEGDQQFSVVRNIKVQYKTNIDINLRYKTYNFNSDISTPFSVPSSYKLQTQ